MEDYRKGFSQEKEKLEADYQSKLLEMYISSIREKYTSLEPPKRQILLGNLEDLLLGTESTPKTPASLPAEVVEAYEALMQKGPEGYQHMRKYIRIKRKQQGLSVADLAQKMHVAVQTIRRWESGEPLGRERKIYALFNALGDYSDFVGYGASFKKQERVPKSNSAFDFHTARETREKAGYTRHGLLRKLGFEVLRCNAILQKYENGTVKPRNPPSSEFTGKYVAWLKDQGYNPYNL